MLTVGARLIGLARQHAGRMLADRLIRNIGWYGLAELVTRVSRLVTTVIIARALSPVDLGLAALAITSFELVRVLASCGLSELVVRAPAARLDAVCRTVHRAGWIVCIAMAAIQIAVGLGMGWQAGRGDAVQLTMTLAAVFVVMPFGLVNAYLLRRNCQLHTLARVTAIQVAADNVLTAVLALAGAGAWAVVLPKVLTAPIWLIGVRMAQSWSAPPQAGFIPLREVVRFCLPVLGSELLQAARLNLDKVIVGALAGIEALGIYYFVFNAGIGFSLSLTSALSNSLFPELARLASKPVGLLRKFDRAMLRAVLPISAIIALQAAAALIYVPIVFGARWSFAAELVAVLCLSAVTKPVFDAAMLLVRAAGAPLIEFAASSFLTCVTLLALAIGLTVDLAHGVTALALTTLVVQAATALLIRYRLVQRRVASPIRSTTHSARCPA